MEMGIDIGTSSILVYMKEKGVVLKEPAIVAYDRGTQAVAAVGEEACLLLKETPGNRILVRPLQQGRLLDIGMVEKMIQYVVQKAMGKRLFKKPGIGIIVPCGFTEAERKIIEEATYTAGAREVRLIESPIAAALGAGLNITKPFGNLILDIGAGTSDLTVISEGEIVIHVSTKIAGDAWNEEIMRYLREYHGLLIEDEMAEEVKLRMGTLCPETWRKVMDVMGRDVESGVTKVVTVTSDEIANALRDSVKRLMDSMQGILEKTPPNLLEDIQERGAVLTGGGSMLRGLDKVMEETLGFSILIAEEPWKSVVIGAGEEHWKQ